MTKQQSEMIKILHQMECELGQMPSLQQIHARTGRQKHHLVNILKNIEIYPKLMLGKTTEKEIQSLYEKGKSVEQIAIELNADISKVMRVAIVVENAIPKIKRSKKKRPPKLPPTDITYIEVVAGPYTGSRGYIEEIRDKAYCLIWHEGNQIQVKLHQDDYKELKKGATYGQERKPCKVG